MVTIAIAIMICAALTIVSWPYWNPTWERESPMAGTADPNLENLIVQRDAAYAAIKDLEMDHTMGKLSDEDYKLMRGKCETKAVAILQELDGLKSAHGTTVNTATSDESLEREIRRLRQPHVVGALKCPRCGAAHTADDAFCAKCGASLRGARCPTCGTRAALGDQFCARCGARIRA
jgi:hypothetical protein